MRLELKIAVILSFWLLAILDCNGVTPSNDSVGYILGYPPSELLITENTIDERKVFAAPSRREYRIKASLPEAAALFRAYLIHAKNAKALFPIQVYIGKKGSFLTSEITELMIKGDKLPITHSAAGTEGFESIGTGGWYFTEHFKVKSRITPLDVPDSVVAIVSVVQPHGQEFDVQIAIRADQDLEPIPGGERYFNSFAPSSEQTSASRLQIAKIFVDLSKLVIATWINDTGTTAKMPPSEQQTANAEPRPHLGLKSKLATNVPAPTPATVGEEPESTEWLLWTLLIVAATGLLWLLIKGRK
jgi:hypothetical protein